MIRVFCAALAIVVALLIADTTGQPQATSVRAEAPNRAGRAPGRGVAPVLQFKHLTIHEGLSQSNVSSILQDRHGFMWIGTQDGLNRFDGQSVTILRPVPFDTTSLSSAEVYALAETADGALWVSTQSGLDRRDPQTGVFKHHPYAPGTDRSPSSLTIALLADGPGQIWLGTLSSGLDRFDGRTGHFEHIRHDSARASSLSSDAVTRIHRSGTGDLWVATANGLNRLRSRDARGPRTFDRFWRDSRPGASVYSSSEILNGAPAPEGYRASVVTALVDDPRDSGVLWAATQSGLVRLDTRSGEAARFAPQKGGADAAVFVDIVSDPQTPGVFWAATMRAGLYRFDATSGHFDSYRYTLNMPGGLVNDELARLYVDRSGLVWVSSFSSGVDRFDPAGTSFAHRWHPPDEPGAADRNLVWGFAEDREGNLWVSTRGGLERLNWKTGVTSRFTHRVGEGSGIRSNERFAIYVDRSGAVWSGSTNAGIDRVDPRTGRAEHFVHDPLRPDGLTKGTVLTILEDRSGTLWVGTSRGLNRFDASRRAFDRIPIDEEASKEIAIFDLLEDARGDFWIGTREGLKRLDRATGAVATFRHDALNPETLSSDLVQVIHERDREPGVLWLGTGDGGLNRFDTRTSRATHLGEADGLPNVCVYGILEDDAGHLWLSTNNGLSDFQPEVQRFVNYGTEVGLQSREYNQNAYFRSPRTGEMFFGGINGFNHFQPGRLHRNGHAPSVVLTGLRLSNQPVTPGPASPLRAPLWASREIRLASDHRSVTFEFAALHYQNPAKNRTMHRLDGLEEDWVEQGGVGAATYTNLAPGTYTFRIRAANSDGVWNDQGARLQVVVMPPWYRTTWAYAVYLLAGMGLVYFIHRFQKARVVASERERARTREMEQAREIERAYVQLKETQAQLISREKLASLGQLTAGIAHEIKNPLNLVNNLATVAVDMVDEIDEDRRANADLRIGEVADVLADLRANVQCIGESGRRADAIINVMLNHARGGALSLEPIDLNALVTEASRQALGSFRQRFPGCRTEISLKLDPHLIPIEGAPEDISRVVINLVSNALYAAHQKDGKDADVQVEEQAGGGRDAQGRDGLDSQGGDGGDVRSFVPSVRISTHDEEPLAVLRVWDNGGGVPEDVREQIFDPFFTTKPAGHGTGLGLSLSYDTVAAHGGALTFEVVGETTTFKVCLPTTVTPQTR